jgi:drug/metabolite transporter (DMT)-like permease
MNYLFFAFIAAICFSLSQVINKLLSKHTIGNTDSLMAYFMLSTFTFGLFLIPFVPLSIPSADILLLATGAIIFFLIGYYCFFRGIFHADASTTAPLFQIQAALVGFLAYIFLGERFPAANYIWMIIILCGAILVSFDEKMTPKSFFNRGIVLVLFMQLFHAVSNTITGLTLERLTPIQVLFWENMITGFFCCLFILIRKPKMNYTIHQVAPMFLNNAIVGLGVLALFQAYTSNLTISSVIGLLSAPIVFIIGFIASSISPAFLEHHPPKVYIARGIGLLIILFGTYKIVVG